MFFVPQQVENFCPSNNKRVKTEQDESNYEPTSLSLQLSNVSRPDVRRPGVGYGVGVGVRLAKQGKAWQQSCASESFTLLLFVVAAEDFFPPPWLEL